MVAVVIPQAFRIMIPPLTNELVLLLKDSSLVFVLGTTADTVELAKFGREAVSRTFNGTPLTVVAILYLAISLPLTRLAARLEKRGAPVR
jgi:polar amino acid transport system permease protein